VLMTVRWLRLPLGERDAVLCPPRGVPIASWAVAGELNRGWTSFFVEGFERDAVEWQLEPRHPLLDPALVSFALSLPEEQRRRGRVTEYVLRRAAGGPPAPRRPRPQRGAGVPLLPAGRGPG